VGVLRATRGPRSDVTTSAARVLDTTPFRDAVAKVLADKHGVDHPAYSHWLTTQLGQVEYFRSKLLPRLAVFIEKPWAACRVLDLGAGSGGASVALAAEGAEVVGIERDQEGLGLRLARLRAAERAVRVGYLRADARRLPLASESFDMVFCNQVVEHVPGYEVLLAEAHRVLKPGGICFVSTGNRLWIIEGHSFLPFANWMPRQMAGFYVKVLRRRRWGDFWDVWPLCSWQLRRQLKRAGFQIEASADHFVSDEFLRTRTGHAFKILKRPGFGYLEPFWPAVMFLARRPGEGK
jgi:2-polyprenyl-3-methyl-5-hydroxy-6-metoxy-1,4-benzoquinol methylase